MIYEYEDIETGDRIEYEAPMADAPEFTIELEGRTYRRVFAAQMMTKERRKIAVVATAHYLARVSFAILRHGEVWCEQVAA